MKRYLLIGSVLSREPRLAEKNGPEMANETQSEERVPIPGN